MECDTSCGRSVIFISSAVHSADSAAYVFTDRQLAVRGGVAMRKSVNHSFFVNNFQTVNVVEVLS